jgi:hypothetical protein
MYVHAEVHSRTKTQTHLCFYFFSLSFIVDSYRKLNELLHMTVMTESLLDDIVIIETKLFSLGVYWMILLSKMSSSNFKELESVRV